MTWNSNSRQPPLVLTDLQSVRRGPRRHVAERCRYESVKKIELRGVKQILSKFPPCSEWECALFSQLQPTVLKPSSAAWRHLWTERARHYHVIMIQFLQILQTMCQGLRFGNKITSEGRCIFFLWRNLSTFMEKGSPLLDKELLQRWVISYCSCTRLQ